MASSLAACPADDTVVRFLEGRLPAPERDEITAHVDGCSRCSLMLAIPESGRSGSPAERGAVALVASFEPGALLAGRYRIDRLLGVGGMGEVYEALDQSLGEPVALKTVRATVADHPRAVERLKSEVLLARRVTHPNVCRIFDFGLHAPGGDQLLPFLTMELLTGTTLAARIRDRRPLAPAQMIDVARQLAAGLRAAHGVEVIHKDLKADNVMLVEEAGGALRAVITDFGLAATRALVEAAAETTASHFSGTPGYVAPERLAGAPVTEATDVYSLGVVMTDMLTNALPSERSHLPAPVADAEGAEAPLARLARRCQALDPRRRPTLPAVLLALEELQRPPGTGRRPRSLRWGAAGLGVLALAVGLAFARSRNRASAGRPRPVAAAPAVAVAAAAPAHPAAPPAAPVAHAAPSSEPRAPSSRPSRRRKVVVASVAAGTGAAPGGGDLADETLRGAEARPGAGRVGEACALGQVAAAQAPRAPAVWEFLGRCYMRLPDPAEARAAYRRYLELAPDGPRASVIRAIVEREAR